MRAQEFTTKILYHATLVAYEDSIAEQGLKPGGDCQMFDWCDAKYVYLSTTASVAESFVDPGVVEPGENEDLIFRLMEEGGVVFSIDASKLDKTRLAIDTNFNVGAEDQTYIYAGVIPPAAIVGRQYFDISL